MKNNNEIAPKFSFADDAEPLQLAEPKSIKLSLDINDPELVAELTRYPVGAMRDKYALAAMSIGIRSLKFASVQLDTQSLQDACEKLLTDFQERLCKRGTELTDRLSDALKNYLDPDTGHLSQRIKTLLSSDGELEKLLKAHVGEDDSFLARSISKQIGEHSPIFRILSSTEADGLRGQLTSALEGALSEQRARIVSEFSLDNSESALTRLNNELKARHGEVTSGIQDKMEALVNEFSFDQPSSAICRLVESIKATEKSIADQFSIDNETSAINKLTARLDSTNRAITSSLSLDNADSALSRLKKTVDQLAETNAKFHAEVHTTLASLNARKTAEQSSPRHGVVFEEQFGELLAEEASRISDVYEDASRSTGAISHCKKGDFVTTIGADSTAVGARIVWEAKDDKSYTLKKALEVLEEARKNRQAQIGVFVYCVDSAPADLDTFSRYGDHIVVKWDPQDHATDFVIRAALSVARALAAKQCQSSEDSTQSLQQIELATRNIERQIKHLEDIATSADTAKRANEKIGQRVGSLKQELLTAVEALDRSVTALRSAA